MLPLPHSLHVLSSLNKQGMEPVSDSGPPGAGRVWLQKNRVEGVHEQYSKVDRQENARANHAPF